MSYAWTSYLNACKAQGAYLAELQWLRTRIAAVKRERDALKGKVRYIKPSPPGWIFERCECGFGIVTMAEGKHYCPKCR